MKHPLRASRALREALRFHAKLAKYAKDAEDFYVQIVERSDGIEFLVRVVPRSSRTEIVGEYDGAVKVRVASPPVDGAANAELIKLFAKELGVARSSVTIVSGETSKTKRLRLDGVTAEQLRKAVAR